MNLNRSLFYLYDLIKKGDVDALERFLSNNKVDLNIILSCKEIGLLHFAVGIEPEEKSTQFTEILLKNGANPNLSTEDGMTPVHLAAIWGRLDNLKLLLGCGGDASIKDDEHMNAYDYAAREEQWNIYDYLHNVVDDRCDPYYNDDKITYNLELDRVLVRTDNVVAEYGTVTHNQINNTSLYRKSDMIRQWCENTTSYSVNRLYPTILNTTQNLLQDESVPWRTEDFTKTKDFIISDKTTEGSSLNLGTTDSSNEDTTFTTESSRKESSINSDFSKKNQSTVSNTTKTTYKSCFSKKANDIIDISGVAKIDYTVDQEASNNMKTEQRLSVYKNFSLPGSPNNITHENYKGKINLKQVKNHLNDSIITLDESEPFNKSDKLTEDESNYYVDRHGLDDALVIVQNDTNEWLSESSCSSDQQKSNSPTCIHCCQSESSTNDKCNCLSESNEKCNNHNESKSSIINLEESHQRVHIVNKTPICIDSTCNTEIYSINTSNSIGDSGCITDKSNEKKCQNKTYSINKIIEKSSDSSNNNKSHILSKKINEDSSSVQQCKNLRGCNEIYEINSNKSNEMDKKRDSIESNNKSDRLSNGSCVSNVSCHSIIIANVSEEYKYRDDEENVVLVERRLLVPTMIVSVECDEPADENTSIASSLPASIEYDADTLRMELTRCGFNPGPINNTTKRLYLKKLNNLKRNPILVKSDHGKIYSVELEKTLRNENWFDDLNIYTQLEEKVRLDFTNPKSSRTLREGRSKMSFTYLLLDPTMTDNLPSRADKLSRHDIWKVFVKSIFYVGKGKRSRPYSHLYQALTLWKRNFKTSQDKKVQHILDIWNSGNGVICLHVFQNIIPAEAYTYEAAMIDVLGVGNLKNLKCGNYYGISVSWPLKDRRWLGVSLLYKAMMIFLSEGERQLMPDDI